MITLFKPLLLALKEREEEVGVSIFLVTSVLVEATVFLPYSPAEPRFLFSQVEPEVHLFLLWEVAAAVVVLWGFFAEHA